MLPAVPAVSARRYPLLATACSTTASRTSSSVPATAAAAADAAARIAGCWGSGSGSGTGCGSGVGGWRAEQRGLVDRLRQHAMVPQHVARVVRWYKQRVACAAAGSSCRGVGQTVGTRGELILTVKFGIAGVAVAVAVVVTLYLHLHLRRCESQRRVVLVARDLHLRPRRHGRRAHEMHQRVARRVQRDVMPRRQHPPRAIREHHAVTQRPRLPELRRAHAPPCGVGRARALQHERARDPPPVGREGPRAA
ncbi:hypothetical protein CLOP_g23226 [Closterium sp. NIES-67]|nr:hypothetical protein CLOP_g23226 [Closterium sp. NIES-67]